jgi:hypothetical protein
MRENFELLGILVPSAQKEMLRQVAESNNLTMSDLGRLILTDGLNHISERSILKLE